MEGVTSYAFVTRIKLSH